jgi:hypothetical protein
MKATPSPGLLQRLHALCAMVLWLLFALTAIGCSLSPLLTPHAVVAEGFTRPAWRPIDAFPPAAERLGREALETIGYDGLLSIARRVDWITTQPRASLPPDIRAGLAKDGPSPGIDVFTKEAYQAGVTTLVDAPVPSRANVHGLGVLVLGLFHAHYLAAQELDGPGGKLLCAMGHPDLMALPCLYLPPAPLPLPVTTAVPVPTPPIAASVPKTCATTDPTSKGHASAKWVGYPTDNPAPSNDPSGPCPQPFVPAPASAVKNPDPPPPAGKNHAENKAILKARQDAEKAERLGNEQGYQFGKTLGDAQEGLKTLNSSTGGRFERTLETNPKLVEELQAGLAAKLNAIPALPADVNPKLARPGFARGFRAGLLDAKLAAVVVDFATNVALALSGDLALLAEQAGATALRAAIARFKSMPVFLPATIDGGGGFVRLPQAGRGAGAVAEGAAAARGGAGEASKASKAIEREVKEAERALKNNQDFRRWFHREYKADQVAPKGGRTNPDLAPEQVREAYQEWIQSRMPR